MNDMEWLAGKVGTCHIPSAPACTIEADELRQHARAGVVVEPVDVARMTTSPGKPPAALVIALVGWPTGRHRSLVKAAEARLAIEEGAAEVWLAVDAALDANSLLADIVAVNQTVESPARLGVVFPMSRGPEAAAELAVVARRAGAEVFAIEAFAGGMHRGVHTTPEHSPSEHTTPGHTATVAAAANSGLEVAVFGVAGASGTVDGVVETLSAGAERVFLR